MIIVGYLVRGGIGVLFGFSSYVFGLREVLFY